MAFLEPLIAAVAEGGAAAGAGGAAAGAAEGGSLAATLGQVSQAHGAAKNLNGGQFGSISPMQMAGQAFKMATTGYQLQADDG